MEQQPNENTLSPSERSYLINLLNETLSIYNRVTEGLSEAQLAYKSDPNRWSIVDVMEHIAIVEINIFAFIEKSLEKSTDPSRRDEIRVTDKQIVGIITNRNGKVEAPEPVRPFGKYSDAQSAREAFHNHQIKVVDFVQTTAADLRHRYWRHLVVGLVDLYQAIVLTTAHTQRHLLQIEEIRQSEGYPKL